jgi:hypothetical protein
MATENNFAPLGGNPFCAAKVLHLFSAFINVLADVIVADY